MPTFVPFASNYINRSNSLGFQWEFYCFRCGNGYMSTFQPLSNVAAEAGGVVARRGAAHIPIFGGLIGEMASDAMSDKAKDAALDNAIREVYPLFAQCPRCGRWRCRAHCWNAAAGLCIDCAPFAAANPSAARPMIPAPVAAPMASAASIQPYAPSQPYGVTTGMPAAPPILRAPGSSACARLWLSRSLFDALYAQHGATAILPGVSTAANDAAAYERQSDCCFCPFAGQPDHPIWVYHLPVVGV